MPVSRNRKKKKKKGVYYEQVIKDTRQFLYKTDGKGIEHKIPNPTYGTKMKMRHRRQNPDQ